jgi:hypothetical protein
LTSINLYFSGQGQIPQRNLMFLSATHSPFTGSGVMRHLEILCEY